MKKPRNNTQAKKPNKRGALTPEDMMLWSEVTNRIIPLNKYGKKSTPASLAETRPTKQDHLIERKRKYIVPPAAFSPPADPEMRHGHAPGLDRRTQVKMKRGKVAVEGRIDLHGLYREQAYGQLQSFIKGSYDQGRKTILVITGKGLRADGRVGVLREAVPGWLNSQRLRQYVHAFSHAAPKDGGEGALYVLLKKKRSQ